MLDTANSLNESQGIQSQSTSKSSAKTCSSKKLKTSNSVQRFWPKSIANAIQGLSKDETKWCVNWSLHIFDQLLSYSQ